MKRFLSFFLVAAAAYAGNGICDRHGDAGIARAPGAFEGRGWRFLIAMDKPVEPLASAQQGPPKQPQQRYRSRISIYDRGKKSATVIFTADEIWEAPNWSHDGKYLLVNSGGNLYRLPVGLTSDGVPHGGTPEKIDLGGTYRCNNDHGFTRDGKLLAFSASDAASRVSQVFQATADGKDVKQMTGAATASYFHGWSPDGKWLAFVGQRNGKFELYRVAAAGGEEQRLTAHGAYDDGPDYTPDGKWIYFNSDRSGTWDIWRIPADGGGAGDAKAERITSDDLEDWFPHVSPDGKWIVFLSFPEGTANHNGKMEGVQLRILPIAGGTPQVLTTIFGGQGTINVNSWSPDSRKFAYVTYEPM